MDQLTVGFIVFLSSLVLSFGLVMWGLWTIETGRKRRGCLSIYTAIMLPPLGVLIFALSGIVPSATIVRLLH